jgi:hypothetical protein
MINPAGGNTQFPTNILQSGVQQSTVNPQNQPDKRSEDNKPQQNRSAEASNTQNANQGSENRNFQALAESILAQRQESAQQFEPAIQRGAVLDITV